MLQFQCAYGTNCAKFEHLTVDVKIRFEVCGSWLVVNVNLTLFSSDSLTLSAVPVDYDAECHVNQSSCTQQSPCKKDSDKDCKSCKGEPIHVIILYAYKMAAFNCIFANASR